MVSFQQQLRCVKAIPHNSKCRYGERGAADAKPKAQIILDVLSLSLIHISCCGAISARHSACAKSWIGPMTASAHCAARTQMCIRDRHSPGVKLVRGRVTAAVTRPAKSVRTVHSSGSSPREANSWVCLLYTSRCV